LFDRVLELATQAKESGFLRPDLEPKLVASLGVALHLGWLVFEPQLMDAAGYKKRDRDRIRSEVFGTYLKLTLATHDVLNFGSWMTPTEKRASAGRVNSEPPRARPAMKSGRSKKSKAQ
jgi:hypothetical protein